MPILRQDPDIIAVGEIRDGETAEIAMRAALTGHLVLSTIHTNDALSTLDRLRNIGVDDYLVTSALRGIISQRLVRCICPACRKERQATPEEKRYLHLAEEEDVTLYHGEGCPRCFGTGYQGRMAVMEILTFRRRLQEAIMAGADRSTLQQVMQEGDFVSMFENGKRLVLSGRTTVEEMQRCLNTED